MAKKTTAKKGVTKPKGKAKKQTKKDAERVLKTGPIRTKPRSQPLPGMEDARIKDLDDICVDIAETREDINSKKADEAAFETTALNLMRKHKKITWQHSGVVLVRVPGEEKLQVRTARKRTATAEGDEPEDLDTEATDANHEVYAEDAESAAAWQE